MPLIAIMILQILRNNEVRLSQPLRAVSNRLAHNGKITVNFTINGDVTRKYCQSMHNEIQDLIDANWFNFVPSHGNVKSQ